MDDMNRYGNCGSHMITVLRQSGYISPSRKAIKLYRCVICRRIYLYIAFNIDGFN